jgi:acyl-CoA synthetase (AMP-forming)/AMP-acid ligase II
MEYGFYACCPRFRVTDQTFASVISHHQHQSVTYDGLQTRSNSIAHGLQSIGVKKGDRVAVSLGSCLEFAVVTYSLFRLGAILVSVPTSNAPVQPLVQSDLELDG